MKEVWEADGKNQTSWFSLSLSPPPLLTELFDNYMQQDAHEFLNYLLNTIADLLQEAKSQERQQNGKLVQNGGGGTGGGGSEGGGEGEGGKETQQTWVHEIFQGTLTNETRCLNCEAVRPLYLFTS